MKAPGYTYITYLFVGLQTKTNRVNTSRIFLAFLVPIPQKELLLDAEPTSEFFVQLL